jgi:hypothetical protein
MFHHRMPPPSNISIYFPFKASNIIKPLQFRSPVISVDGGRSELFLTSRVFELTPLFTWGKERERKQVQRPVTVGIFRLCPEK